LASRNQGFVIFLKTLLEFALPNFIDMAMNFRICDLSGYSPIAFFSYVTSMAKPVNQFRLIGQRQIETS
jgi:hypothetical protein